MFMITFYDKPLHVINICAPSRTGTSGRGPVPFAWCTPSADVHSFSFFNIMVLYAMLTLPSRHNAAELPHLGFQDRNALHHFFP